MDASPNPARMTDEVREGGSDCTSIPKPTSRTSPRTRPSFVVTAAELSLPKTTGAAGNVVATGAATTGAGASRGWTLTSGSRILEYSGRAEATAGVANLLAVGLTGNEPEPFTFSGSKGCWTGVEGRILGAVKTIRVGIGGETSGSGADRNASSNRRTTPWTTTLTGKRAADRMWMREITVVGKLHSNAAGPTGHGAQRASAQPRGHPPFDGPQ